jgi:hypothetical protein
MPSYKIKGRIIVDIETEVTEAEEVNHDESTLQFLVEQDLQEMGYDVYDFKVDNFESIKYND